MLGKASAPELERAAVFLETAAPELETAEPELERAAVFLNLAVTRVRTAET